jgi:hypothetical protein
MTGYQDKRTDPKRLSTILCGLIGLLCLAGCAQQGLEQGRYFPGWAVSDDCCTILFFLTEDLELYEQEYDDFSEIRNIDYQIKRLQLDLAQLAAEYPDLRVVSIDVYQKRSLAIDHRIFQVPTVLILSDSGYEIHRWMPDDFKRGGGTRSEIAKFIEQLKAERSGQEDR